MDGFINLLKPAGMTSHDAVGAVRRILRNKKTGHTGTLDPRACGVLCICTGRATRAAEYLENSRKAYRCEMRLGITTDTGDIWGTPTGGDMEAAASVVRGAVEKAMTELTGTRLQYPPMYSAIKVNGRKLYEYARNGETAEIKPREITIHSIRPVSIFDEPGVIMFDVECSKGTYVRTLCEEIGELLGCGGTMTMLIRTAAGNMRLEDSVTFEEMLDAVGEAEGLTRDEIMSQRRDEPLKADMSRFITPIDAMLPDFGRIDLSGTEIKKFINGGKVSGRASVPTEPDRLPEGSAYSGIYKIYGPDGSFYGTGKKNRENGVLTADKVFFR
ncbi:MAG: tRNA pseudouridine(55) synthase TruB [Anaerovoracaceae bacterium]|nr:tRNA pseudouridine(55) synthase TruB [Bacillota bacterium]MDY2671366.1 tRNA pseudouridine(55) synthase TruB [Anaerovoracaceae bacterium]